MSYPWDTGIRTGQGDAGDYVAHLRENPPKPRFSDVRDFPGRSGLRIVRQPTPKHDLRILKEEYPMRLNIKIVAENINDAINAILELGQADGIKVYEVTDDKGYESVTETHENSPTVDDSTVTYHRTEDIRTYMDAAAVAHVVPVFVSYKGSADLTWHQRRVRVVGHSRGLNDAWRVFDLDKQEPRTFVLSGISKVTGPRI
jgi:hypothetical protein